jgi:hypothetical protein
MAFQGRCKNLRGGAKRFQVKCAPPHTSPKNPAMFDFTFLMGRMTQVLAPDIYIAH